MHIKSMGINYCHNSDFIMNRPGGTNEYILLLIRSKAICTIASKTTHIAPNSVIVYDKNASHYYGADGEPFVNDWICFDMSETERDAFCALQICFQTVYKLSDTATIFQLLKEMNQERFSNNIHQSRVLSLQLELLLLKLSEDILQSSTQKNNYHTQLGELRAAIYNHPLEKWTTEKLANHINLSISYFQHLYKKQFHTSPIADVINSRMEYAKYLLSTTDYPISMIASELNYNTDIQFIQQFKSVTKQTPLNYRKSMKK